MGSIISLIIIISISVIVTKVAAIALMQTGLSRQSSQFQARSAFTGVGFTTDESESITDHPVRRKIVMVLMLLGNAGIISAITSLVLSFIDREENLLRDTITLSIIIGSILIIWGLSKSKILNRALENIIKFFLKRYTELRIRDYHRLLNLTGDYEISEMLVDEEDWIEGKKLKDCGLKEEGIIILGIQREDGSFLGIPTGEIEIHDRDILKLYGREQSLKSLIDREKGFLGDQEHEEAKDEQEEVKESEKEKADVESD